MNQSQNDLPCHLLPVFEDSLIPDIESSITVLLNHDNETKQIPFKLLMDYIRKQTLQDFNLHIDGSKLSLIKSHQEQLQESSVDYGFMVIPDYENMETINRISTNGGTWTVDRHGFIKVTLVANNNGNSRFCSINSVSRYAISYSSLWNIFQVSAGDVVTLSHDGNSSGISCYWMPSKVVLLNPD